MPYIAARVDEKTYFQVKQFCEKSKITITQFLKDSIIEKLIGDTLVPETDWKVNAASIFGITIGQISFAINNSTTVAEAIARINDKTDLMELYPLSTENEAVVQVTRNNSVFTVKVQKSGSKLDMVKKLLKQIEDHILSEVENEKNNNCIDD